MTLHDGDEPPRIDAALDPIRAAISLVADGTARRVTVHAAQAGLLMPAARSLARAAGVDVELVDGGTAGADLVLLPMSARGA